MAGTRHNLFSGRSCDAMATEPKIPHFVYLFYNFVTGWILEILYLHIRAVLGRSQSNQTISTLIPPLAPQRSCLTDQGLKQDISVTGLVTSPALLWLHVGHLGTVCRGGHAGKRDACASFGLAYHKL